MNEHAKSESNRHMIDAEFSLGFSAHYPGGDNADKLRTWLRDRRRQKRVGQQE